MEAVEAAAGPVVAALVEVKVKVKVVDRAASALVVALAAREETARAP